MYTFATLLCYLVSILCKQAQSVSLIHHVKTCIRQHCLLVIRGPGTKAAGNLLLLLGFFLIIITILFFAHAHTLTHLCNDNHHDASFSSCETRCSLQIRLTPFWKTKPKKKKLSVVLNKNTKLYYIITCQVSVFSPWDASLRTCELQHR